MIAHKKGLNWAMYIVLARLILDAIRQPINTALSDTQAGGRKRYTTSQQAMNLPMELHESGPLDPLRRDNNTPWTNGWAPLIELTSKWVTSRIRYGGKLTNPLGGGAPN